jgi:hypothetical protein
MNGPDVSSGEQALPTNQRIPPRWILTGCAHQPLIFCAGAIAALGTSIAQSPASTRQRIDHTGVLADERLLEQLSALFEICFGVHPACA